MADKMAEDRERLRLMEKKIELQEGLPFLHGWNWYKWAWDFYTSTAKLNFLCAANQISKSSTQIRKCINWATDQAIWAELWPARKPRVFWYLYPSADQATAEFETKWQEFMPQGKYKEDPVYGWRSVKKGGDIHAIHFNSGVIVYFKAYAQNVAHLQTGTCDALFCDEEMPVPLFDELIFRISASGGYFHMVFTATLGQDFWRRVIEPEEHETAELPDALKLQVSMYDCQTYIDGTKSHWTDEKIAMVRARCSSHDEVLKRIYGRFIKVAGRKYDAFDMSKHMKPGHKLPANWLVFSGVDIGSGTEKYGHKSAIVFVGVSPDFRQGRVFLGWRGDHTRTTVGDVVEKYRAMKAEYKLKPIVQAYDWGCPDFFTIASRMGEPFVKAEKKHEIGEQVLNTLFKHNMLVIYTDGELQKLGSELAGLLKATEKRKALDDFADALRYAVTQVPWDFSFITGEPAANYQEPRPDKSDFQLEVEARRGKMAKENEDEQLRIDAELAEANEAYGF